jgi:hypothetical protein
LGLTFVGEKSAGTGARLTAPHAVYFSLNLPQLPLHFNDDFLSASSKQLSATMHEAMIRLRENGLHFLWSCTRESWQHETISK